MDEYVKALVILATASHGDNAETADAHVAIESAKHIQRERTADALERIAVSLELIAAKRGTWDAAEATDSTQ